MVNSYHLNLAMMVTQCQPEKTAFRDTSSMYENVFDDNVTCVCLTEILNMQRNTMRHGP